MNDRSPEDERLTIRPFERADLPALMAMYPGARRLEQDIASGSHAVVACRDQQVLGFAAARPLPGLEAHLELQICVQPAMRRQGYGARLLENFLPALTNAGVRMVSCEVPSLDSPLASFLFVAAFQREHDEWEMACEELGNLPALALPAEVGLATFPQAQAISEFRRLYEAAFAGLRSYQPYTSEQDVAQELDSADDLLFLTCNGAPAGFAWLRYMDEETGEVEPIGLVNEYQGQGLGYWLLLAGLHELAERGHRRVRLGVWTDNERAIRLYRRLGFRPVATRYYLAKEL
jgi:mycothiol synthase